MKCWFTAPLTMAALLLAAALPAAAQESEARISGKFLIPDTSIEHPGDVGHRVHTNHKMLLEPAGGLGPSGGMTPAQLWAFYGVPASATSGGGGVIAIVDAYHYATALNDFNVYAAYFGLPIETSTNVTAATNTVFQVVYAGGKAPKVNAGWNQEAALDIEWAHAMAPKAKIVLVEANSASFADMYAAVDVAARIAGVKQVSMSWGGSETSTEAANDSHFQPTAAGPLFFASSGDTGGVVIYPSCSQYVVAVGGTSVATTSGGYTITTESAWSSGGGGNSAYIAKPSWQSGIAGVTGARRGVPDISADADPNTGCAVYDSTAYRGYKGWMVFGGTSLAAPCVAGMVNTAYPTGTPYTNTSAFLASLYARFTSGPTTYFRDITTGSNGNAAKAGWDYATGVGAPVGPTSF